MSYRVNTSGRGWSCTATRVFPLLLLLLLTPIRLTTAQDLPTCTSTLVTSHITNTSTPHLHLSCSVPPPQLAGGGWLWQWDKLADDPSSSHLPLQNATSFINGSTYHLPVECGASGQYQASYLSTGGDCVYSCQFFVEVVEVISEQILDVFESFPNQTSLPPPTQPNTHTRNLSFPLGTPSVPLGVCSGRYHLSSGCILDVGHAWFRDGAAFEPTPDLYTISVSSSITIRNVTDLTAGCFVCITELPSGLGSYRTEDVCIAISTLVVTPTPSLTIPSPTTETTPTDSSKETLIFGLELWEVGLVVANIVAVLLLFVCVCMAVLCLSHRRSRQQEPQHVRLKEERENEVEKEEEGEFMDFTGPSEIPFSAIMFEELLHKGTFKTVHHAFVYHPPSGLAGLEVAVKRLKDENSELGAQELMAEAYMLKSVHDKAGAHPNIISLIGVTSYGGPPCLLLEYMPHGTLDRFLWSLKKGPVPEWYLRLTRDTIHDQPYHRHVSCDLMRVIVQVAEGMRFLTEQGFVHRDLSTRNILVGNQLHIKIANPGMFYEGYYYVVSEREHFLHDMAPECLWEKRYSIFSDVWSFGILLYKMITLETNPYPGLPVRELYDRIVDNNLRPQILSSFSNQLYFLLQRCWQLIPVERPTFSIVLSELQQLCSDPTKHIILKVSKDELTPGYVGENGQVFLRAVPAYVFQIRHTKLSGTQRSNVSSADDTIYSRETADSILYLHSEAEGSGAGQETDEDDGMEWLDERSLQGKEGEEVPLQVMKEEGESREHISLILESNVDEVDANNSGNEGSLHDKEDLIDKEGSREKLVNL